MNDSGIEAGVYSAHLLSSEKDLYLAALDLKNRINEKDLDKLDEFLSLDDKVQINREHLIEDGEKSFFINCQARGVFREKSLKPIVGDRVLVEVQNSQNLGIITKILPRKNIMNRPPVANVDQFLLVQSLVEPSISSISFDKILVAIEKRGLSTIICFNKSDRIDDSEIEIWQKRYKNIGYKVFVTSVCENRGISELKKELKGRITAIAGPSGVGKSSIISLFTGKDLDVGSISRKTHRGKQTTRKTKLYSLDAESFIFDTPGFSSLKLDEIENAYELASYFPEMRALRGDCKFRNCRHLMEPSCAIKKAIQDGDIDPKRYESYVSILKEIEENRTFN